MSYEIAEREGPQPGILYSASSLLRTEGDIKHFLDKWNVKRVHLYQTRLKRNAKGSSVRNQYL